MKFKVKDRETGREIRDILVERFDEYGFVSIDEMQLLIKGTSKLDLNGYLKNYYMGKEVVEILGWDDRKILRRMQVKEFKDGWAITISDPKKSFLDSEMTTRYWEKPKNEYYTVWNVSHGQNANEKEDARRPCIVKFGKKTWNKGYFHKWVANTFPTEGFLFSNMLALVELEDGSVVQKDPKCIIFVDGGGFDKWEDKR